MPAMTVSIGSQLPPPLPAHAVTLLLSHLSPLDRPLPPHLLSTSLRQRHTFLALGNDLDSADDAATYLSWPTTKSASGADPEDTQRVIADLLAALPSPEHFDPLSAYPTKYTFDGEAVYAHACVPIQSFSHLSTPPEDSGLRLVFRWEADEDEGGVVGHGGNADGWKYHDAKPMPFPSDAQHSPDAALNPIPTPPSSTSTHANGTPAAAALLPPNSNSVPRASAFTPNQYHADVSSDSDSDDDAYWNSYGRSGSDDEDDDTLARGPHGMRRVPGGGETDEEKAEDAYWARYASVHGTADSTRPSPLVSKRKLHDPSQPLPLPAPQKFDFEHIERLDFNGHAFNNNSNGDDDDADDADVRILRSLAQYTDLLDPTGLSPEALARRLQTISPRPSLPSTGPSPAPLHVDSSFRARPGPEAEAEDAEMINRIELDLEDNTVLSSSPPTSGSRSGSDGGLTLTSPTLASSGPRPLSNPTSESESGSGSGSGSYSSPIEILSPRPTNAHSRALLGASPTSWEDTSADTDAGLRDAIKGMYRLWAGARKQSSPFGGDEKEAFVEIIRDVLAEL